MLAQRRLMTKTWTVIWIVVMQFKQKWVRSECPVTDLMPGPFAAHNHVWKFETNNYNKEEATIKRGTLMKKNVFML